MIHTLTYVSSATRPISTAQLRILLTVCRTNNEAVNVSGLLLYKDAQFIQVLEGPEIAVREIHSRIRRDARHRALVTLQDQALDSRVFADWSMGFRDLTRRPMVGFDEVMNTPFTGTEFNADPARAQRLLVAFRQHL